MTGRTDVLAVALDIGSSSIKAARYTADGRLAGLRAVPVPPLTRTGLRCEGDAATYAEACESLLHEFASGVPAGTPLGIAAQRSTFLLWERRSGRPVTPMISWQDRRAVAWCARHLGASELIRRRSGLVLSPHYAGPKLAVLMEEDAALRRSIAAGRVLFGTLETFLIWRLSGGRLHTTDVSMAARTCLLDPEKGQWDSDMLDLFGVAPPALPEIVLTSGRREPLSNGFTLTASVADQAAGALALLDGREPLAIVNVGTGTFVLSVTREPLERRPGFLTAPLCGPTTRSDRFVLEGAINGPCTTRRRDHPGPVLSTETDPAPAAYCLPDAAGLGSPYWRADLGFTLSPAVRSLHRSCRQGIILEGVLFRSREILDRICPTGPAARLVLAGGLSRSPEIGAGLAALLGREVESVTEPEQTLVGAARLASGDGAHSPVVTTVHVPGQSAAYLPAKYGGWRAWMSALTGSPE